MILSQKVENFTPSCYKLKCVSPYDSSAKVQYLWVRLVCELFGSLTSSPQILD